MSTLEVFAITGHGAGELDAAIDYLMGVTMGTKRIVLFGDWTITALTFTDARAITLKVHRMPADRVGVSWERHFEVLAPEDVPDAFLRLFLHTCSEGWPPRFAGDNLP